MVFLILLTTISVLISFFFNREKTYKGVLKGLKMLYGIFPDLILIIMAASVLLSLIPEQIIVDYLGQGSGIGAIATASLIGSVALIPGFIAFPLAAMLKDAGVSLSVLAVFLTTLMMVGVITFPVEMKFFGFKATLLRNSLSFVGAIIIGLLMGALL